MQRDALLLLAKCLLAAAFLLLLVTRALCISSSRLGCEAGA